MGDRGRYVSQRRGNLKLIHPAGTFTSFPGCQQSPVRDNFKSPITRVQRSGHVSHAVHLHSGAVLAGKTGSAVHMYALRSRAASFHGSSSLADAAAARCFHSRAPMCIRCCQGCSTRKRARVLLVDQPSLQCVYAYLVAVHAGLSIYAPPGLENPLMDQTGHPIGLWRSHLPHHTPASTLRKSQALLASNSVGPFTIAAQGEEGKIGN